MKPWILAAGVIFAFLAILLAIVVLTPERDRSQRGTGVSVEDPLDKANAEGTSDSEVLADSSGGNAAVTNDGKPADSSRAASENFHATPRAHDADAGGSASNQANGTMSALESASPEPANEEEEKVRAGTTRSFFTLDSKSQSMIEEADEQATGGRVDIQDILAGRRPEAKGELLREGGGTSATEGAVKLGLEWLARNQQSSGLWSLRGPYDDGGMEENVAAATAMALLAFQGAGHTHKGDPKDPYTAVVARGSTALIEHIRIEGESYRNAGLHGGYTQALCTIALCELFGMTRDPKLRKPVQNAVDYCIEAQSAEGGWRYTPRQDSDTSVTGWFVLALQSAKMARLKVPDKTFGKVAAYLNSAGNHDGTRYGYQHGTVATRSMTAEALLCRQYLGWNQDDPRLLDGADYLLDELPSWESSNVYYWYYATQVFHHLGGTRWKHWNEVVREILPSEQVTVGRDRGSWRPRGDIHAHAGGRLYVTCMCLYMLEVYYRHLPIYQGNGSTR
jgi:hypothetical protein